METLKPEYIYPLIVMTVLLVASAFLLFILGKGIYQNYFSPIKAEALEVVAETPPAPETRYEEKEPEKAFARDPNRFGRWRFTFFDLTQATKIGFLHKLLASTPNVKSYHEIK